MRTLLQPAFVLHRRPYRETSLLVDLFTAEHGRITAVARGMRSSKPKSQVILEPFTPFLVSWFGKGEIVTLNQAEVEQMTAPLKGDCLLTGFYLNELLMRLLHKADPQPTLYTLYSDTLAKLRDAPLDQKILRGFEKRLLEELGYGLLPEISDVHTRFLSHQYYQFTPEQGFVTYQQNLKVSLPEDVFSGQSLIEFTLEAWTEDASLKDAKRLVRLMLEHLLGAKPLYSRQLFVR